MGRHALSVDDNLSAIRYFTQAIEARPTHSRAYYLRAYAKFVLEDYSGAEADCSKSIELNPFISETYQLRGLCRLHIKDFRGSISDYGHTLREQPRDEAALFNTALCHMELHEPDSAETFIDKFLEGSPKFYRAYLLKAQIALEERHDTLQAIRWADTIIVLHREEAMAWLLKAESAFRSKDFAQADSFLTEAIRYQQPPNFMHHLMRAEARHALNRFGDALEDYDAVIGLVPEHFVAHYNRGLLRALVGDDNRAIDDFDFVLDKEPDNTLARYNRALLREQTGDLRGAISDYTILLRAYPEFLYGYHARAQLRRRIGDIRGALNDETVLARHNLDVAFAKPRRHSFRKVRQRSDHELDQYDQPIATTEERGDTVRIFGDNIFGKVQNTPVGREFMPMLSIRLSSHSAPSQKSSTPLGEAEAFARRLSQTFSAQRHPRTGETLAAAARIILSASPGGDDGTAAALMLQRLSSTPEADSLLSAGDAAMLRSLLYRDTGEPELARAYADSAVSLLPDAILPRLHRASLMLHAASALNDEAPHAEDTRLKADAMRLIAETDIAAAERSGKQLAAISYARGCIMAAYGRYQDAVSAFDEAVLLDSELAEAYYNRALARLNAGGEMRDIENDLSHAGQLGLHAAYSLMKQIRKK